MDSKERKRLFEKHKVTPDDLVNHLFLPKRLPQSEEPHLQNIETAILEYLNLTSVVTLDHLNLSSIRETLESWVAFDSGDTNGISPVIQIVPKDGMSDRLYKVLESESRTKKFTVFKRDELCGEPYYYCQSRRRIHEFVTLAFPGYAFGNCELTLIEKLVF